MFLYRVQHFIKTKVKPLPLAIGAMACLFLFVALENCAAVNDVKKNGRLVKATLKEYISGKGSGKSFRCEFYYKNKKRTVISISSETGGYSYENKVYPALYSPKYDELKLLITDDDYTSYNVDKDSILNIIQ